MKTPNKRASRWASASAMNEAYRSHELAMNEIEQYLGFLTEEIAGRARAVTERPPTIDDVADLELAARELEALVERLCPAYCPETDTTD